MAEELKKKKLTIKKPEQTKIFESDETRELVKIEPDRVFFKMGRKISDDNYGHLELSLALASSSLVNETLDETVERVIEYVESKLETKISELVND